MDLVSVVIPVYNVESYLKECVDSVIKQTYTNLEIILVDDGSTDSSGLMCDDYCRQDNRIVVVHQGNHGLSNARNCGAGIAKGDYLYYLDSDDFIALNAIEKLIEQMQLTHSDVVFFDANSFNDDGDELRQNYIRKFDYPVSDGLTTFCSLIENRDFHSPVYLLFFRMSFYKHNSLSFKDGVLYEDMIFTFNSFLHAGIVSQLNESLYFRRFRAGSIVTSHPGPLNLKSSIVVFEEVFGLAKKNDLLNNDSIMSYVSRCGLNVYNIFDRLSTQDKIKYYKDIIQYSRSIKNIKHFVTPDLYYRSCSKYVWAVNRIIRKINL